MKILKYIIIIILLLIAGGYITMKLLSDKKPESVSGNGDAIAVNMLDALNYDDWQDVQYLTWNFLGMHTYHWDKQNNNAIVSWKDYEVYINLDNQSGTVFKKGEKIDDSSIINDAWVHWCNDSFWMFAPFKVFDPGTTREEIKVDSVAHGLMVTYESGGVTPGDSYLWLLNEDYQPTGYKMWVKILPLKGAYASWSDWIELSTGAKVATRHKTPVYDMQMRDVKDGSSWAAIGKADVDERLFNGL